MPLDHYVSQVHLRNFYSPALGELLYAVRKRDGKAFTPNSESVCRIEDGSSNAYLTKDRVVEEFLKSIEPKYNATVKKLGQREIDQECVYVIAGFAAYVMACSPAGMRIQTGPLKSMLETTALALDAAKEFPPPPTSLGGESMTELIQTGKIKLIVDPKYPQAIGIANILELTKTLGNFKWDILQNDSTDSPFFTSDFPIAIEDAEDPRVLNRVVPLSPTHAVRIRPDAAVKREEYDFSFAKFDCRFRKIDRGDLRAVNRRLVQCAEEVVFYRDDHPWVKPFIAKNSAYRIEMRTQELPRPSGKLLWSRQVILPIK